MPDNSTFQLLPKGKPIGGGKFTREKARAKVSEAEKGDTLFVSKAQADDTQFRNAMDALLAKKGLCIVWDKLECASGKPKDADSRWRSFVGELDYTPPSTALE